MHALQTLSSRPKYTLYGSVFVALVIPLTMAFSFIGLALTSIVGWGLIGAVLATPVTAHLVRLDDDVTVEKDLFIAPIRTHGRAVGKEYAILCTVLVLAWLLLLFGAVLLSNVVPSLAPALLCIAIGVPALFVYLFGQFTAPAILYNRESPMRGLRQSIAFCRTHFRDVVVFTLVRISACLALLALVVFVFCGIIPTTLVEIGIQLDAVLGVTVFQMVLSGISLVFILLTVPFGIGTSYLVYYLAGAHFYATKEGIALFDSSRTPPHHDNSSG